MKWLPALLLAYAAASLLHFAHNAEFLAEYPNLPASFTREKVYAAWLAIACIGLAGWLAWRRGWELAGLSLIVLYAAVGFDSLAHYVVAPVSAHSFGMNLTIGLELAAAAALLGVSGTLLGKRLLWRAS